IGVQTCALPISGPRDGRVREQKPRAGEQVPVGTPVDLRLAGGPDFVDRLTGSIAADSAFATLELDRAALRESLVRAGVTTPEAAQKIVTMGNPELQQTFGLRNLTHARSFRRMVREALAQLEAEG